jgi:protein-tyrosine sulfotransferase
MRKNSTDTLQPLFILSCSRSGSTLLRFILDTHPEICSPGELHLGRLCGDLRHVLNSLNTEELKSAPKKTERRINSEINRLISKTMREYVRRKGKQLWCEKAPDNLDYLHVLSDVFDGAKYICLHRHCLERANSCLSGKIGFGDDLAYYTRNRNKISALVDSWVDRTERLLRFERENPSRCFRMKYESLVSGPGAVLGQLFSFLEKEWDSSLLDRIFTQPHDPGQGDAKIHFSKSIHTRSVGLSSGIPVNRIDAHLFQKMNDLLAELGYPRVGTDWAEVAVTSLGGDQAPAGNTNNITVLNVEELFMTHFPQRLQDQSDKIKELRGIVIKIIVHGSGGGVWLIDLTEEVGQVMRRSGEAHTTIKVSETDLFEIVNGRLSAAEAFARGNLKVTGSLPPAIKLGVVLF